MDLAPDVRNIPHVDSSLLNRMLRLGVPVPLKTPPLDVLSHDVAVVYGSHGSCDDYQEFLHSKIADLFVKDTGQCFLITLSMVGEIYGYPHWVASRDRRPCLVFNYTWSGVNPATV